MSGDLASVGVIQPAFDTMVGEYVRAAAQIERLAQALWSELSRASLDTSPAVRIRDVAARLRGQAADLQRRRRLVHEMERQRIAFGLRTEKGMFWSLPDRLEAVQVQVAGVEAAGLASKAATGDGQALARLAAFAPEAADPRFARSFLDALGPYGVIELPAALAQRLRLDMDARSPALGADEDGVQKALKLFARSLSAGTNPANEDYVGDPYIEALRKQGRADHQFPNGGPGAVYTGYQSLATLLALSDGRPPFSSRFLAILGQDMVAYDREHRPAHPLPRTPPAVLPYAPGVPHHRTEDGSAPMPDLTGLLRLGWALTPAGDRLTVEPPAAGRTDVLNGLLNAAAFSKEGAQALLDHTAPGRRDSDLEYLLHERRPLWAYTDHATTLGRVMATAMAGHDPVARRLFKETSELLGRDTRRYFTYAKDHRLRFADVDGHADDLSGLRPALGEILRSHLDSVDDAFFGDALGAGGPKALSGTPRHRRFACRGGSRVTRHSPRWWKMKSVAPGCSSTGSTPTGKGSQNVLISQGRLLGHILAMRREVLVARGVTIDAANRQIKDLIDQGIGLVPVPYADVLGRVPAKAYHEVAAAQYGKLGDWLFAQRG